MQETVLLVHLTVCCFCCFVAGVEWDQGTVQSVFDSHCGAHCHASWEKGPKCMTQEAGVQQK